MAPTLWRYLISAGSLTATIWIVASTGALPVQDAAAALVVPSVFVIGSLSLLHRQAIA